jgi:hypothetical protein
MLFKDQGPSPPSPPSMNSQCHLLSCSSPITLTRHSSPVICYLSSVTPLSVLPFSSFCPRPALPRAVVDTVPDPMHALAEMAWLDGCFIVLVSRRSRSPDQLLGCLDFGSPLLPGGPFLSCALWVGWKSSRCSDEIRFGSSSSGSGFGWVWFRGALVVVVEVSLVGAMMNLDVGILSGRRDVVLWKRTELPCER